MARRYPSFSAERWAELIREQQSSDVPVDVFCARKGVSVSTFNKWRRQIDGLAALVAHEFGRNPADRCLYVFTNRGRDKIKRLIWHLNGYWLLHNG